ncbi:GstE2 family protein [Megaselia abdita]
MILYGFDRSPPVRACLMTLKALDISFEFKNVHVMNREHLTPEFLKMNPIHTVPVLEDGEHFITDSHVICTYLVQKYGSEKDQSLYPKDLIERTVVDQRLFFDLGVLFVRFKAVTAHIFTSNKTEIPKEKFDAIIESYDFLETFLDVNKFVAGKILTVADICCMASVTSMTFVPLDPCRHPKTISWFERMQYLPFYSVNRTGSKVLVDFIKQFI